MFVIAILGCGDGSAHCQAVATLPTRYENRLSCAAATTSALMANTRFDFPELQAECRSIPGERSTEKSQKADTIRG